MTQEKVTLAGKLLNNAAYKVEVIYDSVQGIESAEYTLTAVLNYGGIYHTKAILDHLKTDNPKKIFKFKGVSAMENLRKRRFSLKNQESREAEVLEKMEYSLKNHNGAVIWALGELFHVLESFYPREQAEILKLMSGE